MHTPDLLLHVCCGPCSIHPVRELAARGVSFLALYDNPNIHPYTEWARRRDALFHVAAILKFPVEVVDYDPRPWLHSSGIAPDREARCVACYTIRLDRAAHFAQSRAVPAVSSTLLYSKHQNHEAITQAGQRAAQSHSLDWVYADWRIGWKSGIELSKKWGVHRQSWCGCLLSEQERYAAPA